MPEGNTQTQFVTMMQSVAKPMQQSTFGIEHFQGGDLAVRELRKNHI